jgi:hypothetical protein
MRGLVPNVYIHVSVRDLYIPKVGLQTQYSNIKLLTDIRVQKLGTRPRIFISGNICFEF